jgi:tetratricopeptide (TPR) repeat protein
MTQNESQPPVVSDSSSHPSQTLTVKGCAFLHRVRIAGGDIVEYVTRVVIFSDPVQVIAALAYVTLVAGLAGSIYWLWQQPSPLRGDFNIAVAEFYEIQDGELQKTDDSARIGLKLFNFLEGEYKRTDFGLDVKVGHSHMRDVYGDSDAARLARRVNADLVIFGTLFRREDGQIELQPRFFVVSQVQRQAGGQAEIRRDVDEVLGAHPFTLTLTDEIESSLETRAAVLSSFTQGLIRLHSEQPWPARALFDDAIQKARDLGDWQGLPVLDLFAAVASRQVGDYPAALAYLDEATRLDPGYGRAGIARGNVYFGQAMDGCQASGLDDRATAHCQAGREDTAIWYLMTDQALHAYEQVAQTGREPYSAYLQEKGWLGVGNVYLWAAQNHDPGFYDRAAAAYQQVTASYERTPDQAKRNLAAYAYRYLGVARERQGRLAEAQEAYRQCVQVARYDEEVKQQCQEYLDNLQTQERP